MLLMLDILSRHVWQKKNPYFDVQTYYIQFSTRQNDFRKF